MGRHGTIAGRKEAQDKKRAASFTKLVRLITVAARGGENPEFNVALKHAIENAIIVEALTDNKNRTASSVKMAFDRNGGNLGVSGSVSYMFGRKGEIIIEKTDAIDEEALMEVALEAGMEDMETLEDSFYITTETANFDAVADALRNAGYELLEADIQYLPSIEVESLGEEDLQKLKKLIDTLENDDDVQKVHHNYAGEL